MLREEVAVFEGLLFCSPFLPLVNWDVEGTQGPSHTLSLASRVNHCLDFVKPLYICILCNSGVVVQIIGVNELPCETESSRGI